MDYAEIFRLLPQPIQVIVSHLSLEEMETLCRVIVEHHGGPLSTMSDEAWAALSAANASKEPRPAFTPKHQPAPTRPAAGGKRKPYKPNLMKGDTK
jgi:hypothetical protein